MCRSRYKKYKSLYKKSLEQGELESQRSKLWELEESLDVTNILIARQQARLEVKILIIMVIGAGIVQLVVIGLTLLHHAALWV